MANENTKPAPAVVSSGVPIDKGIPMPAGKRRSSGMYPLDKLEVGESFHVAKTGAKDDPVARLSSTVSSVRNRYSPILKDENGKDRMETVERTEYKRGASGKGFAKDEKGKRIVARVYSDTRPVRGEPTRNFKVVKVGDDDPRGPGARCFRIS